jgi:8-oxo-dGTP diphosphatase|tara:strand:- start:22815 stop:23228 length:414 start_codon:yes stop_codon:yes gene_type:complete
MEKKFVVIITAIVLNEDNKFLLVKRKENQEIHPGKWLLPGGKLEEDESLFQALKREIKEETNLEIEDYNKYINDYIFERPNKDLTLGMTFLVKATNDNVSLNKREYDDFIWITKEELQNYDYLKFIKKEVEKAFKNK